MELRIDGMPVEARPGASLLDLLRELGLDTPALSTRPLAAKLAGEVFTLNYIPVRVKDADPDRPSIRRAMAASDGEVRLLRITDAAGWEAYARTAQFVMFLALRQLWPQARGKMDCTMGSALYVAVHNAPDFSVERLKERMQALVDMDIPLVRSRISTGRPSIIFRSAARAIRPGC